jgi:1-acyl-sn-glycerol-3-phosphate acyltransferase
VTLGVALAANFIHFAFLRIRGPLTLEQRTRWLQSACRRVMAAMGIHCSVTGVLPARGLVVSNHLSYIDILIYGALMPCFFVSKAEVEKWPYFGWAARTGGALFLDRQKRSSTASTAQEMSERLMLQVPVLLFPEGTSTDGSQVLRFYSGLFAPAAAVAVPVTAAAIRYVAAGDVRERELCWFGDALFLPHLWKMLGTRGLSVEVCFAEPHTYADRRTAAHAAHREVARMRGLPEKNESSSSEVLEVSQPE